MEKLKNSCAAYFHNTFSSDADVLAITGSHAAGLANSKSDLDLILLTKPESRLDDRVGEYINCQIDGVMSEILIVDPKMLSNIARRLSQGDISEYNPQDILLNEKIVSAIPVIGHEHWGEYFHAFDVSVYRSLLCEYHLKRSSAYFDDMIGSYAEGDLLLAVDALRITLSSSLEAFLCRSGDTYGKRKWLSKRIVRCPDADFSTKAGYVYYFYDAVDTSSGKKVERWLCRAQRFVQFVNSKLLLSPNQIEVPEINQEFGLASNEDFFLTSDFLHLICIQQKYYLKTRCENLVIDEVSASILSVCCFPMRATEIKRQIAQAFNLEGDLDDRVEAHLEMLCDESMLRRLPYDEVIENAVRIPTNFSLNELFSMQA